MKKKTYARESAKIKAAIFGLVLFAVLTAAVLSVKKNLFLLPPVMGISANAAVLYIIYVKLHPSLKDLLFLKDRRYSVIVYIEIFSIMVCISLTGIRLSDNLKAALLWNSVQIFSTSSLLVIMLAFSLFYPRPLFKKSIRNAIIYGFYFLNAFILSIIYIINIIEGRYLHTPAMTGGIYYELDLSAAGFIWAYPVVKVVFVIMNSLTILFLTYQLIRTDNRMVRKYFSYLYASVMAGIFAEVLIITFLNHILGIRMITFFGLATGMFSVPVAYYVIHVHEIMEEMEKVGNKPGISGGKVFFYTGKMMNTAKNALLKFLKQGTSAIVFSVEEETDFYPGIEKYKDNIIYIKVGNEGYTLGDTRFGSIKDIESLESFPDDLSGTVIYSNTLPAFITFDEKRREEGKEFFRFLTRAIRKGATIIAPVESKYAVFSDFAESDTPAWYVRPLMVLRLEECAEEIYSKLGEREREKFLTVLRDMKKEGLPFEGIKDGELIFDISADMDADRFSRYIRRIAYEMDSVGILKKEKFHAILKKLFETYGDSYTSLILMDKGLIYFTKGERPNRKAIKALLSMVGTQRKGMIISRTNPLILRRMYAIPEYVDVLWLTNLSSGEDIMVPHLESIKGRIFDFIGKNRGSIVVLDGIEYLTRIHGFPAILEFLEILKDGIATTDSSIIIPIDPGIFEKQNREKLAREFEFLE